MSPRTVTITVDDLERLVVLASNSATDTGIDEDGMTVYEPAPPMADLHWLRDLVREHQLPTAVIP